MNRFQALSAVVLGLALAPLGCAVEADESSPLGADDLDLDVPLTDEAFESWNGLSASCFWDHGVQSYLRFLAGGPLANGAGVMPPPNGVPSSCYLAIQDTVKCALPAGTSVTNPANGATYSGAAGLAGAWRNNPLSGSNERRWITACLTLLVNSYGSERPILLVGNNPAIADNPTQSASYPFKAYTIFGDLFSSTNPLNGSGPAFMAFACSEGDLDAGCNGGGDDIQHRSCDGAGALCGINYLGPCSSACSASGPYWSCGAYGYSQTVRAQWPGLACAE